MRFFIILIFILLASCSSNPDGSTPKLRSSKNLTITEIKPNKWTAITRQNLEHLFQVYDLRPYLFTLDIQIESKAIPTSHPVLKLNTRYAEEPNKLLSLFIHEQLHWWAEKRKSDVNRAIEEIKSLFSSLPLQEMAQKEKSSSLHLLICFLEYDAIIKLMGKKEANKLLKDLIYKDKVYPWIYKQVYFKFENLKVIVDKYNLSPKSSI
jgi:hypothetical protein